MGDRDNMLPHQYCLRWKFHNANIQSTFSKLLEKDSFCDVTLWCCGSAIRAHRAVLASCSALLCALLAGHDASLGEPAFLLDGVDLKHLKYLLAFMYTGEVSVHHTELAVLLKTAEDLRVKGLADISWRDKSPGTGPQTSPCSQIDLPNNNWTSSSRTTASETTGANHGIVNGSTSFSSMPPRPLPTLQIEPIKRKRGRPPLEPRIPFLDNEPVLGGLSPKRAKMVSPMPNILKKHKTSDTQKDDSPTSEPFNCIQTSESSVKNEKPTAAEELSSEYSEASLDGRDISQFLDTTMEEEEVEASNLEAIVEKSDPSNDVSTEEETPKDPIATDDALTGETLDCAPVNPVTAKAALSKQFAADLEQLHKSQLLPNRQQNQQQILQQFSDVVKLSDYLVRGRRPQFWAEDYVKRVMEAVFCKELEMKQAAEMLGVSYGTLYGRYRDCFGCINRPHRVREFWKEHGPSEILMRLRCKDISLFKAAEILNVTPQTLSVHLASVGEHISLPFDSIKLDRDEEDEDLELDNEEYDDNKCGTLDYGDINDNDTFDDNDGRGQNVNDGLEERLQNIDDDCEILSDEKEDDVGCSKNKSSEVSEPDNFSKPSTNNGGDEELNVEDKLETHKVIASKDVNKTVENSDTLNEVTGKLDADTSNDITTPESRPSIITTPRELPRIRVANLRFLRGDFPLNTATSEVLSNRGDLMGKKKVTFEDITTKMSKKNGSDNESKTDISEPAVSSDRVGKDESFA